MNYLQVIKALYDLGYIETIKMYDKEDNQNIFHILLEDKTLLQLKYENRDNIQEAHIMYHVNADKSLEYINIVNLKQELFKHEMNELIYE